MATNFYLDKSRPDKNGECLIRASISVRSVRVVSSLGLKVQPGKWDDAKQKARKGCVMVNGLSWNVLNAELSRIADYFTAYENRCITERIRPDKATLLTMIAEQLNRPTRAAINDKDRTFFDIFDEYIMTESKRAEWADNTIRNSFEIKRRLYDFNPKLTFANMTEYGLMSFVQFEQKRGLKNDTIHQRLDKLRAFLRWSERRGYHCMTDYKLFVPTLKSVSNRVVFLEWDELLKIYTFDVPKDGEIMTLYDENGREYQKTIHDRKRLIYARDLFCFCAFTSLRYSDVLALQQPNIIGGKITITTKKTYTTVTIELNKYAKALIAKYVGADYMGAYVLPYLHINQTNKLIKTVCELCGINKPITRASFQGAKRVEETRPKWAWISSHTARRTFICNALSMGIPPQVVMKWTGHENYMSMKPYIDISDATKEYEMNKFNKK